MTARHSCSSTRSPMPPADFGLPALAGWTMMLGRLAALLAGQPVPPLGEGWQEHYDHYARRRRAWVISETRKETEMTTHQIGTRDEWLAARLRTARGGKGPHPARR